MRYVAKLQNLIVKHTADILAEYDKIPMKFNYNLEILQSIVKHNPRSRKIIAQLLQDC